MRQSLTFWSTFARSGLLLILFLGLRCVPVYAYFVDSHKVTQYTPLDCVQRASNSNLKLFHGCACRSVWANGAQIASTFFSCPTGLEIMNYVTLRDAYWLSFLVCLHSVVCQYVMVHLCHVILRSKLFGRMGAAHRKVMCKLLKLVEILSTVTIEGEQLQFHEYRRSLILLRDLPFKIQNLIPDRYCSFPIF